MISILAIPELVTLPRTNIEVRIFEDSHEQFWVNLNQNFPSYGPYVSRSLAITEMDWYLGTK